MNSIATRQRYAATRLGLALGVALFAGCSRTPSEQSAKSASDTSRSQSAKSGPATAPDDSAKSALVKLSSDLPDDSEGALEKKFDNLRNYRYCEVDLIAEDKAANVMYAASYNTTGENGGDKTRDSAPQSLVDKLDPEAIAKQYHALFVFINPPRYWVLDWFTDRVGKVRDFDGLKAPWMGNNIIPKGMNFKETSSRAYHDIPVARTSAEGFNKGSKVYLLDDPEGRTWIMKSYTDKDLPGMTIDKLDTLGSLITLPKGWKFRTAVLDKDLELIPKSGVAHVTQDDKQNTYDLTGPGQSNFTP